MNIERKNVIWNMIGSTAAAFTSLVFQVIAAQVNGVESAGMFSYAFATACLLYVIGSYIVRAFQVTDISEEFTDSDYFYHRIITCLIMMAAAAGFVFVRGYDAEKCAVILLLCGMKSGEAFAEFLYGVLQKNGRLWQVGISMFAKAFLEVSLFLIIDLITRNLLISCISIFIVYIVGIILYDIPKFLNAERTKSGFSLVRCFGLFKVGFFTFLITILTVYLINAPRYVIDRVSSDADQAIYSILILPATFMNLLAQYLIQPILVGIAECIKKHNYIKLRSSVIRICGIILVLGVFVVGVAYLLEAPVLSFIFGVDIMPYHTPMMIIILGSVFYGLETVLSNILIAFRKTGIQAAVFSSVSVLTVCLVGIVVAKWQLYGAAVTYLCIMALLAVCFAVCTAVSLQKYKNSFLGRG